MIWGLPIFFKRRLSCGEPNYGRGSLNAAVAIALLAAFPLAASSVVGQVELKDSNIASVRKGQDYSGVVIWLLPAEGIAAPRADVKHTRLIQKDKTFTPHVLAIETGTTVDFPNYDPIFHNALWKIGS